MSLKTLLFVSLFAAACLGSFVAPIWPILGYIGHYCVGPEGQWWHAPLRPLGIRYSFTLAILAAISIGMHWPSLRFGKSLLQRHEMLLLAFLGAVWFASLTGAETVGRYSVVDHPAIKFTKVVIFALMATHVITTMRNLDRYIWVLVAGAAILGMRAYAAPKSRFHGGRLEGIGGPDFAESNFFAAFMVVMLWIIGVQFLRSDWKGKIACFLAGGFTANAVILTRSRGALVGLAAGGMVALFAAPKRYRALILTGLIVAGSGFFYLTDEQFLNRMASIFVEEEERDESAQSRVVLAKAGLQMLADHPFGVGPGNFYQNIGNYIPEYAGKDAHNTYVRCFTETGVIGFACFVAIILNAFHLNYQTSRRASRLQKAEQNSLRLIVFGSTAGLTTMLACCMTISLTYVEFIWWFLMLPVCLQRVTENMVSDYEAEVLEEEERLFAEGGRDDLIGDDSVSEDVASSGNS